MGHLPWRLARARSLPAAAVALSLVLLLTALIRSDAGAVAPSGEPFLRTWARTDKPVADLLVSRTWMWGPEAFTDELREPYVEGHDNSRAVQYFDKARMEITTDPSVPYESPWFVTTGLLAKELMTGMLQLGDSAFEPHQPSNGNVAGDPEDTNGPTYAALGTLMGAPPHPTGQVITAVVGRDGTVSADPQYAGENVTAAEHVALTGHTVASVFWAFMNSSGTVYENGAFVQDVLFENAYYATGYPTTEAYWTRVELAGVLTAVLVQCFERRCLTYTPSNPDGWQVESGNVGRHYHAWRYVEIPAEATPTATPTETAQPTATPTSTPTATATETPAGTTGDLRFEYIRAALPGGSLADMRVVIRNMQQEGDVNIAGWQLRDDAGNVFTFPDVTVLAGFYVEVRNCAGNDVIERNRALLYWGTCSAFPQGTAYLIDSFGDVVDTWPR